MALNEAMPHVLVVAGTDSSGGAGIARDVETLSAFGVRACLAVTAVTAQTDRTVDDIEIMPARLVESQMRAALASRHVGAIKLGMLASPETVFAVCRVLHDHRNLPVVADTVLASSSGRRLMKGDAISAYELLYPLSTVLTPNLPELAALTGCNSASTESHAADQAQQLINRGARAVLVKGGHATGYEAVDQLVQSSGISRHAAPRLKASMRGTGCMLASAIAASLALGSDLPVSVSQAKAFVLRQLDPIKNSYDRCSLSRLQ